MIRLRHSLLCMLLFAIAGSAAAGDALVLVTAVDSPVATPDSLTVRKAFMGLSVSSHGGALRALVNDSDSELRPVFLQNVVGFSEQAYQRRVLTLKLQQGSAEPRAYRNETELARALQVDQHAISFMWQSHAQQFPGLRILKVLWQK